MPWPAYLGSKREAKGEKWGGGEVGRERSERNERSKRSEKSKRSERSERSEK